MTGFTVPQQRYLDALRADGLPATAAEAAGVTRKTATVWLRDVDGFADAADHAQGLADAEILAKARQRALGSDGQPADMSMLALLTRANDERLQPKGSNVNVGVKVGGPHAVLDDVDLVERARRILADYDLRAEQDARYVDVDARMVAPGVSPAAAGAVFVGRTTPAPADEPKEAPVLPEDLL